MSTLPSLLSRSIRAVALPVINGKLVESRASSVAASDATASIVICLWSRRIQSSLRRRAALCEPPFAIIGSRFIRPRAAETARLSRGYDFGLGMQKSVRELIYLPDRVVSGGGLEVSAGGQFQETRRQTPVPRQHSSYYRQAAEIFISRILSLLDRRQQHSSRTRPDSFAAPATPGRTLLIDIA